MSLGVIWAKRWIPVCMRKNLQRDGGKCMGEERRKVRVHTECGSLDRLWGDQLCLMYRCNTLYLWVQRLTALDLANKQIYLATRGRGQER